MKSILISDFSKGMADDRLAGRTGEFSVAKHFDILTNPKRLQPLRGMSAHTASTGIGNFINASDGFMYGMGTAAGNGKLWVMGGYGASDNFLALSTNQLSGQPVNYEFLVDWPDSGNTRTILWASTVGLVASNYSGLSASTSTQALTFTTIGQGFVHPKDRILYFPYRTATAGFIGYIPPAASIWTGFNANPFALPVQYRAYCLTNYGDQLAIPLTSLISVTGVNSNMVALWSRDTSLTTFDQTISWGAGVLKVLNNLQGLLIGISELSSSSLQAGTAQDYNSIQIKVYSGGAEPLLVKEIKAIALSGGSGNPLVTINPRVNFIAGNRLYFSATINPNDGIQQIFTGLFSVGREKSTGEWVVNLERMATNANTETSIIAAAMVGDYVEMVYTAEGTLSKTTNGNASSSTYGATSVYESCANPDMAELDSALPKKLYTFASYFQPLPSGASVVMKYRVDSIGNPTDWITVATITTTGATNFEAPNAAGVSFTDGTQYEFRLESTGGAVITGFGYKYDTLTSLLTK